MALADIEKKYDLMNEACELLQEKLQDDCLDALIENFDNLLNDGKVHVEDGIPDEKTASKLAEIYRAVRLDEIRSKTIVAAQSAYGIPQGKDSGQSSDDA